MYIPFPANTHTLSLTLTHTHTHTHTPDISVPLRPGAPGDGEVPGGRPGLGAGGTKKHGSVELRPATNLHCLTGSEECQVCSVCCVVCVCNNVCTYIQYQERQTTRHNFFMCVRYTLLLHAFQTVSCYTHTALGGSLTHLAICIARPHTLFQILLGWITDTFSNLYSTTTHFGFRFLYTHVKSPCILSNVRYYVSHHAISLIFYISASLVPLHTGT